MGRVEVCIGLACLFSTKPCSASMIERPIVPRLPARKMIECEDFTAQGFGHYHRSNQLTTRNGKSWRFHRVLPFVVRALHGTVLVSISHEALTAS